MFTSTLFVFFSMLVPEQKPEAAAKEPAPIEMQLGERQSYLLHAPKDAKAPATGWKLLVVMPGGDGGADFAPFVGRIRENALGDDWLVAQMVAPVWSKDQAEKLVWPTKLSPWPKMEFTCEEFFDAVVADVAKTRKLDPKYLFTLGWSSGGPLAYTLGLREKTNVTGTFVAMSVFKPEQLPKLSNARGRAFHVLHSPEDWIPIAQAEDARDGLRKAGASVTFATYSGGHGWHGDVYGLLRAGVAELERTAKAVKSSPKKP
ncbi:MAG: hypothetical protein HZA53_17835 [Planctomycetes bacterium]|nr:hypothetical protein [Planctomycetota bacterium]